MKGVDNGVFESGDDNAQGKSGDFEMKEQPSDDTTVNLETSKPGRRSPDLIKSNANVIVRWNLKFRGWLRSQLFGESHTSKLFRIFIINGAAVGILVASVVKHYANVSPAIDWCDGTGFLWILYILTYVGVLIYLTKKFLGKCISDRLKPLTSCLASLGAHRYSRAAFYLTPVLILTAYVIISPGRSGRRAFSFLGIIVFVALGYLFSRHPAHIKWRPVICGMALQFAFGLLTIQLETGKNVLDCVGKKVTRFLHYTEEGAGFVFGYLAKQESDITPIFAFSSFTQFPHVFNRRRNGKKDRRKEAYRVKEAKSTETHHEEEGKKDSKEKLERLMESEQESLAAFLSFSIGKSVIQAFRRFRQFRWNLRKVLPVVYFLGFFINILSYYGVLQWFIIKLSAVVRLGMGTTVCESVNAAASIFLGMTEAPLLIRSYLKDLTKSEICAILCAGWSTVAGVVMAAYIQFGVKASHLIAASVMSAPASLSYSKLIYPETEESKNTIENIVLHKEKAANALDAASKGALSAIAVIGSITANIIAFLAFISFLDGTLNWIGALIGFQELSFQFIMSKIFYPISFLMGVDEDSLEDIAYLIGIKTVANEFQAYQKLGELIKANKLSERSETIATYALCGFSNLGSIGITVGTLSAMEPSKSSTVTEVAIPAFIAANIVCFLTACVAGCLID